MLDSLRRWFAKDIIKENADCAAEAVERNAILRAELDEARDNERQANARALDHARANVGLTEEIARLQKPEPPPEPGKPFRCPDCHRPTHTHGIRKIYRVETRDELPPLEIVVGVTVQCIECLELWHVTDGIDRAKTARPRGHGDPKDGARPEPPKHGRDGDLRFAPDV